MNLNFNSDLKTVGDSLMETLTLIEKCGETPALKAEMLFKYARVKFLSKDFKDAYKIFGECSIQLIDNGLPEIEEIFYWVGRIFEEQGSIEKAKSTYSMLLARPRYLNDQEFVDELLDRINKIEKENK